MTPPEFAKIAKAMQADSVSGQANLPPIDIAFNEDNTVKDIAAWGGAWGTPALNIGAKNAFRYDLFNATSNNDTTINGLNFVDEALRAGIGQHRNTIHPEGSGPVP